MKNDEQKPSENSSLWVEEYRGTPFITDGHYKCPEVKGRYKIRPFKNPSGKLVPCLQGYRPINGTGSIRYRQNFESLKQADAQREFLIREDAGCEQRTHTVETTLPLDQIKDAEAATEKLAALPPPDWNSSTWSLVKAVDFVAGNFKSCPNPKPLVDAVAAYIECKDKDCNRAAATLDSLRVTLRRLTDTFPSKCVHEVSEADLRLLIRRGTQMRSMKRLRSVYSNFFTWCAGRERNWTPHNPAVAVELPDRTDDVHIPQILPVADVRKLLAEALRFKGGRLFLFCAVAFGCALRPSEMGRIQARRKVLGLSSFHFGDAPSDNYIEVIGKCRGWRKVTIPEEFVQCIRTFVDAEYPIIPRNFFNDWTHLRAVAGYLGSKGYLPNYIDAGSLKPWVDDYPRHTGGSHHFNRSENEYKTARWMGNSPKMLFGHYDGRPTQSDTVEFYTIPSGLKLPTAAELQAKDVPDMATDSELNKLKCPVGRHTTFGLKKNNFEKASASHLAQCPSAAKPEVEGFTRKAGIWSKRRKLALPPRAELLKLFWTFPLSELGKRFQVTRATMSSVADDHRIPLPPIGHWQQRASGKQIDSLPSEVIAAFPDGLPRFDGVVGRTAKPLPPPADLLKLIWAHKLSELPSQLGCSLATIERAIRRLHLPKPGHSYWHAKPENRKVPERIQHLLSLDSQELESELRKSSQTHLHE